ncbi:MAG: hypothetical protein DMD91_00380, partial [Candidatus Rokuibacteriota bacterium]
NDGANTVSILLGLGNGSFAPKTDLATGVGPFSVAIDDLNGDGKPDIVVADVDASANSLTVLLNTTTANAVLVAAVLPSSRSVRVGVPATAFATIINAATTTAVGCTLGVSQSLPATFGFQSTNPATNQVTGTPNGPVDIPAGSADCADRRRAHLRLRQSGDGVDPRRYQYAPAVSVGGSGPRHRSPGRHAQRGRDRERPRHRWNRRIRGGDGERGRNGADHGLRGYGQRELADRRVDLPDEPRHRGLPGPGFADGDDHDQRERHADVRNLRQRDRRRALRPRRQPDLRPVQGRQWRDAWIDERGGAYAVVFRADPRPREVCTRGYRGSGTSSRIPQLGSCFLVAAVLLLVVGYAGAVELQPFLSGLSSPLYLTHSRDGTGRLFVVEQAGVIKVLAPGAAAPTVAPSRSRNTSAPATPTSPRGPRRACSRSRTRSSAITTRA